MTVRSISCSSENSKKDSLCERGARYPSRSTINSPTELPIQTYQYTTLRASESVSLGELRGLLRIVSRSTCL